MRRRFGLRGRVVVLTTSTAVVLFSVLGTVGFVLMAGSLRSSVEATVEDRLETVSQRLSEGASVSRQIWSDGSEVVVVPAGTAIDPPDHTVQIIATSSAGGDPVWLVGRSDVSRLDDNLASIRRGLWIAVAASAVLVGSFTWFAVDRALSPVAAVIGRAESIYRARSAELLPVPDTNDELTELIQTLNQMLERLRDHEERHRQFVSDASHELRTPLMVLLADAENAAGHADDLASLPLQVIDQTMRLGRLTDELLTLATLDEHVTLPTARLGDIVAAECTNREVLDIVDTVERATIPDIGRSIRNLLANAHRHGDIVTVTARATENHIRLHIDDDGPGVEPADRERIFGRFQRGDASRSRESGGSGLGLAIVDTEVTAAGGTVTISTSPAGGARFTLEIPMVLDPDLVGAGAAGGVDLDGAGVVDSAAAVLDEVGDQSSNDD